MAMQTPRMTGPMVIKANRGEGESPREEDTTMDEDGEREMSEPSELSKAPATPHAKVKKAKAKRPNTRRACIPKQAKIVVLAKVRTVPCDQCRVKGHQCHSHTKGGQQLNICIGCQKQKLSCRMSEVGSG